MTGIRSLLLLRQWLKLAVMVVVCICQQFLGARDTGSRMAAAVTGLLVAVHMVMVTGGDDLPAEISMLTNSSAQSRTCSEWKADVGDGLDARATGLCSKFAWIEWLFNSPGDWTEEDAYAKS